MPEFYFSEDFKAKARAHVAPLSVKVLREVTDSPILQVEALKCTRCGFSWEVRPPKPTPATAIHDCEWTHEFSWETAQRCGGQIAFVTVA